MSPLTFLVPTHWLEPESPQHAILPPGPSRVSSPHVAHDVPAVMRICLDRPGGKGPDQGGTTSGSADPGIPIPESEATILNWIKASSNPTDAAMAAEASRKIALHGWGIWTSLTAETNQVYQGQKIRVFETWLTPEDLTSVPDGGPPRSRRRHADDPPWNLCVRPSLEPHQFQAHRE